MKSQKATKHFSKWRALIIALPIVFLVVLVWARTANVPFWDEWELVPIFQHIHSGHIYIHDFWQQHNEHRLFFPTLALVALAPLTHWNVQIECMVSIVVAICSFLLIQRAHPEKLKDPLPILLVFLLALIWFSPEQQENWLWGWQLEWFLNVFGIVLTVYGVAKLKKGLVPVKWLACIIAGGVLAQYSLGNGTIIWPLLILALLFIRVVLWQTLVVFVSGALATILYYIHYNVNAGEPSKHLALQHPVSWAKYILLYTGRPLSYLHKPALLFGFLIIISFLGLLVYLLLKRRDIFRQAIPWAVLGLYAIGSAIITGVARLGYGLSEALSSRYTTIALLLLVSLLMLLWLSREVIAEWLGKLYKPAVIVFFAGLYGLVIINGVWGIHAATQQHTLLTNIHSCTIAADPSDTCLLTTYPNATIVRPRLDYIKSLHWGGY